MDRNQDHQDDEDDILPDTDFDRERTLTGKFALFVLVNIIYFQALGRVPDYIFCTANTQTI